MSVTYSTANIVVNGNAESGPSSTSFGVNVAPQDWVSTGTMTAVTYSTGGSGDLNLADGIDAQGGISYFAGGTSAGVSTASQVIDVSAFGARIDAGRVTLNFAAQLGGFASQNDAAKVEVRCLAADGTTVLGTVSLNGPLATDRGSVSLLADLLSSQALFAGTRSIEVVLTMTRSDGSYNDGYADNISVHLSGLLRGQVLVNATQDFTAETISRATGISFLNGADATASFLDSQFGLGLIAKAAHIGGSTGTDTVAVSLALGAVFSAARFVFEGWTDRVDTLVLTGNTGAEVLTGSDMADRILAGAGADTANGGLGDDMIEGGKGRDRLHGGDGADQFILSDRAANRDIITDFTPGEDVLVIDTSDFGAGLAPGALSADAFVLAPDGQTSTPTHRFSYDAATGRLYFDVDGADAGSPIWIATLLGQPGLGAADFLLT